MMRLGSRSKLQVQLGSLLFNDDNNDDDDDDDDDDEGEEEGISSSMIVVCVFGVCVLVFCYPITKLIKIGSLESLVPRFTTGKLFLLFLLLLIIITLAVFLG